MDKIGGGEPDPTNAIDVLRCLRCGHEGCTNVPSWGYPREVPTLCSEHATPAMVQVVALCCEESSCNSRRTFGFDGGEAQLCAKHKLDGMVDLMKRRSQVKLARSNIACIRLSCWLLEVGGRLRGHTSKSDAAPGKNRRLFFLLEHSPPPKAPRNGRPSHSRHAYSSAT